MEVLKALKGVDGFQVGLDAAKKIAENKAKRGGAQARAIQDALNPAIRLSGDAPVASSSSWLKTGAKVVAGVIVVLVLMKLGSMAWEKYRAHKGKGAVKPPAVFELGNWAEIQKGAKDAAVKSNADPADKPAKTATEDAMFELLDRTGGCLVTNATALQSSVEFLLDVRRRNEGVLSQEAVNLRNAIVGAVCRVGTADVCLAAPTDEVQLRAVLASWLDKVAVECAAFKPTATDTDPGSYTPNVLLLDELRALVDYYCVARPRSQTLIQWLYKHLRPTVKSGLAKMKPVAVIQQFGARRCLFLESKGGEIVACRNSAGQGACACKAHTLPNETTDAALERLGGVASALLVETVGVDVERVAAGIRGARMSAILEGSANAEVARATAELARKTGDIKRRLKVERTHASSESVASRGTSTESDEVRVAHDAVNAQRRLAREDKAAAAIAAAQQRKAAQARERAEAAARRSVKRAVSTNRAPQREAYMARIKSTLSSSTPTSPVSPVSTDSTAAAAFGLSAMDTIKALMRKKEAPLVGEYEVAHAQYVAQVKAAVPAYAAQIDAAINAQVPNAKSLSADKRVEFWTFLATSKGECASACRVWANTVLESSGDAATKKRLKGQETARRTVDEIDRYRARLDTRVATLEAEVMVELAGLVHGAFDAHIDSLGNDRVAVAEAHERIKGAFGRLADQIGETGVKMKTGATAVAVNAERRRLLREAVGTARLAAATLSLGAASLDPAALTTRLKAASEAFGRLMGRANTIGGVATIGQCVEVLGTYTPCDPPPNILEFHGINTGYVKRILAAIAKGLRLNQVEDPAKASTAFGGLKEDLESALGSAKSWVDSANQAIIGYTGVDVKGIFSNGADFVKILTAVGLCSVVIDKLIQKIFEAAIGLIGCFEVALDPSGDAERRMSKKIGPALLELASRLPVAEAQKVEDMKAMIKGYKAEAEKEDKEKLEKGKVSAWGRSRFGGTAAEDAAAKQAEIAALGLEIQALTANAFRTPQEDAELAAMPARQAALDAELAVLEAAAAALLVSSPAPPVSPVPTPPVAPSVGSKVTQAYQKATAGISAKLASMKATVRDMNPEKLKVMISNCKDKIMELIGELWALMSTGFLEASIFDLPRTLFAKIRTWWTELEVKTDSTVMYRLGAFAYCVFESAPTLVYACFGSAGVMSAMADPASLPGIPDEAKSLLDADRYGKLVSGALFLMFFLRFAQVLAQLCDGAFLGEWRTLKGSIGTYIGKISGPLGALVASAVGSNTEKVTKGEVDKLMTDLWTVAFPADISGLVTKATTEPVFGAILTKHTKFKKRTPNPDGVVVLLDWNAEVIAKAKEIYSTSKAPMEAQTAFAAYGVELLRSMNAEEAFIAKEAQEAAEKAKLAASSPSAFGRRRH
jgi:hypothetical protein